MGKLKYIDNYNKTNYKMYQFRVKRSDVDIINKLDNINNRNSYILSLIREDINSSILSIKQIKDAIRPIMEKYEINEVYLFGSYARGEAKPSSDVDLYCSAGNIHSLFDRVGFVDELEEALGKSVDVITIGTELGVIFKKHMEEDLIRLI